MTVDLVDEELNIGETVGDEHSAFPQHLQPLNFFAVADVHTQEAS